MPLMRVALATFVLLVASASRAEDRREGAERKPPEPKESPADRRQVRGRLSLTVGSLSESGGGSDPVLRLASPDSLLWTDWRGVVETERRPDEWAGRADFRLRLTGDSYVDARSRAQSQSITTARGYGGGKEYELRELYATFGGANRISVGRQILVNADALTIDGVRLSRVLSPVWQIEGFAGLVPNPFSRSMGDDYLSAGDIPLGLGGAAAYDQSTLHGAFAVAAIGFTGGDAGNALVGAPGAVENRVVGVTTETARIYLHWRNYWRPHMRLDLSHYLVFDLTGEAGPQITNGHFTLNWRATDVARIEVTYSHLSSIAWELFIKRFLLRELSPNINPLVNNLLIMRMAQDQVRLLLSLALARGRVSLYGSGRLMRRSLLENLDPRQINDSPTAVDLTVGVRDNQSLGGFRLGLEVSAFETYRSLVYLFAGNASRELWDGKGTLELQAAYQLWRDDNFNRTCDLTRYATCFGITTGSSVDLGALLAYRFNPAWYILGDYHLTLHNFHTSERGNQNELLLTHVALFRIQYRF